MVGRALGLGRRGDLPQFAVLTGVSTGALLAANAQGRNIRARW
jgi:hypothetical protein